MCLGGSPKPNIPAPPPVERDVSPDTQAARDRTRQLAAAASGMSGNTVTGARGLATPAPVGVKTLLGQ